MTLQAKQFGSKCTLSEKFINQVILQVDQPKLFTVKCFRYGFFSLWVSVIDSIKFPSLLKVSKCGIVDNILSWMKFKAQTQLNKKLTSSKTSKMKGIPKLDDANDAGTRNSRDCTLILTEGDSAKSLAVAGLGVVGRDKYGVFPLKGKVLNVREATHKQVGVKFIYHKYFTINEITMCNYMQMWIADNMFSLQFRNEILLI